MMVMKMSVYKCPVCNSSLEKIDKSFKCFNLLYFVNTPCLHVKGVFSLERTLVGEFNADE